MNTKVLAAERVKFDCIKLVMQIDPAYGSVSLLLNFAKILGKKNVSQGFCGQEINITTYNLCRINMFLHDVEFDKFDIGHGDTLNRRTRGKRLIYPSLTPKLNGLSHVRMFCAVRLMQ